MWPDLDSESDLAGLGLGPGSLDSEDHARPSEVQASFISKLAIRKTYLRILANLRIAKPCKTRICETLRILRNKLGKKYL